MVVGVHHRVAVDGGRLVVGLVVDDHISGVDCQIGVCSLPDSVPKVTEHDEDSNSHKEGHSIEDPRGYDDAHAGSAVVVVIGFGDAIARVAAVGVAGGGAAVGAVASGALIVVVGVVPAAAVVVAGVVAVGEGEDDGKDDGRGEEDYCPPEEEAEGD